jgi:hypothetical protein
MNVTSASRAMLVTALVASSAALLPPVTAQAAPGTVAATLVKTTWTGGPNSNWTHPSPDPSGVTYNSRTGQLIISDGEVEENDPVKYPKNVWKGTNLFVTSLSGTLLETGANTMAYSKEPTGVGFRPDGTAGLPERLFISDDDQARIFEVNRGSDGRYGTADDTQTSSPVAFLDLGPRNDAEDLAVDLEPTRNGQLLLVDGKGKRAFVYDPGSDGVFNGTGDTVVRTIDLGPMGAGDPEGIAYNAARNTMLVLDDPSNRLYEVSMDGTLLNRVTLPFTMKSGAGIAFAPPSGGGSGQNAYIVDRGVDNDTNQDTFNDGRLYEIKFDLPPLGSEVVEAKIVASADDAEEVVRSGAVTLASGDLDLPLDGTRAQLAGMRFSGVTVPQDATITKAYVQFQADEVSTGTVSLTITGELASDAAGFTTTASSISSRPQTAGVTWSPADWSTLGARTATQQTADLSSVVEAIVSQSEWASGNHLVLIVKPGSGTGTRVAESFDGGAAKAPVLHIEYTAP